MDAQAGGLRFDQGEGFGALFDVEGGREGNQKFEAAGVGGREVAGGLEHFGQVVADLFGAAAGSRPIQVVVGSRPLAAANSARLMVGRAGRRGVADEFGIDGALAVEGFFKGEDDQHAADVALNELDAVFFPGPELGLTKKMTGTPRRWNCSASLKWMSGKSMRTATSGRRARMEALSLRNSR